MANLEQRAGAVIVRIGGTSLDTAIVVDGVNADGTSAVLHGVASPVSPPTASSRNQEADELAL